jgi:hypothetical protein
MENKEINPNDYILDTSNLPKDYQEFDQAEWVFQFDDEEPEVFAWSTNPEEAGNLSFILSANSSSSITFVSPHTGKKLNVFSREMSEETRAKRTDIPDYSDLELKTPEEENA